MKADGRSLLAAVELGVGLMATAGGLLLVIAPNGSLLAAAPSALSGSPFDTWRVPGVLLATLVGGGYIGAAVVEWRGLPAARSLSVTAGLGLIVFEAFELAWLGFQPLEAVFAVVGLATFSLALRRRRQSTDKQSRTRISASPR